MRAKGYKLLLTMLVIASFFLYATNTNSITNYAIINTTLTNISSDYLKLNNDYQALNESFNKLALDYQALNESYASLINKETTTSNETTTGNKIITTLGKTINYAENDKVNYNITFTNYLRFDWRTSTYVYINMTVQNTGVKLAQFNISKSFPLTYFVIANGYEYEKGYGNTESLDPGQTKQFFISAEIPLGNVTPTALILNSTSNQITLDLTNETGALKQVLNKL